MANLKRPIADFNLDLSSDFRTNGEALGDIDFTYGPGLNARELRRFPGGAAISKRSEYFSDAEFAAEMDRWSYEVLSKPRPATPPKQPIFQQVMQGFNSLANSRETRASWIIGAKISFALLSGALILLRLIGELFAPFIPLLATS